MKNSIRALAWMALLAVSSQSAPAADSFYLARYQEGRIAYQTGNAAEAVDLLRIGCFGFLDEPPLLTEGLVWLSLAQSKAGRMNDLDASLRRFLEVEKRFGTFAAANVPAPVRAEFGALLTRRIPADTLVAMPSLAAFADTEDKKILRLPPKERQKALEAKAAADPRNPTWPTLLAQLAEEQRDAKEAIRWATRALEVDDKAIDARKVRARARFGRKEHAGALDDLRRLPHETLAADAGLGGDMVVCLVETRSFDQARETAAGLPASVAARDDVAAALKRIPPAPKPTVAASADPAPAKPVSQAPPAPVPVAIPAPSGAAASDAAAAAPQPNDELKRNARAQMAKGDMAAARASAAQAAAMVPKDRDARKLLLEVACLSADWKTVATEAAALDPFRDGEEPHMFYASVGLFETGRRDEARTLLQRARTQIRPNPFVDYYTKRILP